MIHHMPGFVIMSFDKLYLYDRRCRSIAFGSFYIIYYSDTTTPVHASDSSLCRLYSYLD